MSSQKMRIMSGVVQLRYIGSLKIDEARVWVDGHLEKMARQQGTAKLHKKRAKSEHDDNCPPTNPSS